MKPSVASYRLWLLVVLAVGLTLILGIRISNTSASVPTSRLFDSRLAPVPTATASRLNPTVTSSASPTPTPERANPPASVLMTRKVRLPLIFRWYPSIVYGWKGLGDPGQLDAHPSDGFWGIYPDWWYNWGTNGPYVGGQSARGVAETLAGLEAGLQDPRYVPMIWCPADVYSIAPTPSQAADLARRYPGRVWLMFNEPDNTTYQCGMYINNKFGWISSGKWAELGTYLAQQYAFYYDAIKAADPHARLFAQGLINLPMPTLPNPWWQDGVPVWNAFMTELAHQGRPLDGIAIHAYPNNASTFHQACLAGAPGYLDYPCVERSLTDAHRFFQGNSTTAGKTIWITEIGSLTSDSLQSWTTTRDGFESPMLAWFNQHIQSGQDGQYINAISWFSTHYKTQAEDYTASDLLNYKLPDQKQRTPVGDTWKNAICTSCQCPGPDCR